MGDGLDGIYHYHKGSKKSQSRSGIAFASYYIAALAALIGHASKKHEI